MVTRKSKNLKKGKSSKKSTRPHPLQEIKTSEAILMLSDPLRKKYRSVNQIEAIISITVIAWNISLFPDEEQENVQHMLIERIPDEFSGEDIGILLTSIDSLIEKKKQLYPHIREYILKYDLSIIGDKMTLSVGTAPAPSSCRG